MDLEALSERARDNNFYTGAALGRDHALLTVLIPRSQSQHPKAYRSGHAPPKRGVLGTSVAGQCGPRKR